MDIKKSENDKHILTIFQEENMGIFDPRNDNNLGTMICFHRNYMLGDKHNCDNERILLLNLCENVGKYNYEKLEEMNFSELRRLIDKHYIMLPLYLYDHSGITIRTTSFNDRWDSGQVGYIYVSHKKVKKEYGYKHMSKKLTQKIKDYLISEVKLYDQFLTGKIYGFILEKKDKCRTCGNIETNVIESCGGFFGYENLEQEIKGYIPKEHHNLIDNLKDI